MFIFKLLSELLLGQVPLRLRSKGLMQATVAATVFLVAANARPAPRASVRTKSQKATSQVENAVQQAADAQGMRVEIGKMQLTLGKHCAVQNVRLSRPLQTSSKISVFLTGLRVGKRNTGRPCQGMAQVNVRIFQEVAVVLAPIERGQSLIQVSFQEQERLSGILGITEVPPNAVAARRLEAGTTLSAAHMMPGGPQPGSAVSVTVAKGSLKVSTRGIATRCRRRQGTKDYIHGCARLASGKVVQGRLQGRQIIVESF